MKKKTEPKVKNVEVSGRNGDHVGLACVFDGAGYHVWLNPRTLNPGERLYKNPLKDVGRDDPAHFNTRLLSPRSEFSSRLIAAMLEVYKRDNLLAKFEERERKEQEERAARDEEARRQGAIREAAQELFAACKEAYRLMKNAPGNWESQTAEMLYAAIAKAEGRKP